jgi:L-lactate dehydrogenase complex protein LldF
VHWAATAADAREIVLGICREANAKLVTKGKSMVSEEIALNGHLEAAGLEVVETDLGEYLVQIRKETPSHIIAPAIHLTEAQIEADFRRQHTHLPKDRPLDEPVKIVSEAREILREKFITADVGITGANFLIAETGSSIIVTNEGNGDLTQSLARVHVVVTSIDKVVPTLEDAAALLRLLARSATGQEFSVYTTFSTGPRRPTDPDGPEAYHVVVLDNGRSALLDTPFREVLRCIRCGACMNHCPVYGAVGGHAYGWVYPGPIGAVINPAIIGLGEASHLPNASTFCGRCESVCPMKIPLPGLMREWRKRDFAAGGGGKVGRFALSMWSALARRPRLYHAAARLGMLALGAAGRQRGAFRWLPMAGGWTRHRDLAAPQGRTFQQLWAEQKRGVPR